MSQRKTNRRKTSQAAVEAARRRSECVELYCRGLTMTEIAGRMGINVSNVSRHVRTARDEWRETRRQQMSDLFNEELAKIALVERRAWEILEKGETGLVEVQQLEESLASPRGLPWPGKMIHRELTRSGPGIHAPRLLGIVLDCVARRVRLLGLGRVHPPTDEKLSLATVRAMFAAADRHADDAQRIA